jgi:hypothetical protein
MGTLRHARLSVVVVAMQLVAGASASLAQQTPSGPARGKSCSDIDRECVRYDFGGKIDESQLRCLRYKEFCLRTGVYYDGRRTITGVVRE